MRINQRLLRKAKPRRRAYKHQPGTFALTASFRDDAVTRATINLVGRLVERYSQREIAGLLGTSTSTIGKMVRVYCYTGATR